MIEKEYYRLDELAPLGVTEGTIRYFIEQEKLTPAFFVSSSHYVLGGYLKNEFNGFAIAEYQGLISFPAKENISLLKNGKVSSNTLRLLQRGNIVIKSTDYPFSVNFPNTYISGWQKWTLNQFNSDFIPAKCYPFERDSGFAMASDFVVQLAKIAKMEPNTIEQCEAKMIANQPRKVLSSVGFDFTFNDICIRHDDLIALGIIKLAPYEQKEMEFMSKTDAESSQRPCFDNEFEELIANIILTQRSKTPAKKIHRILCDECTREEDSRLYDTNNILQGDDQGIITWRDKYRGNQQRSYQLNTLKTLISKIKKKLAVS